MQNKSVPLVLLIIFILPFQPKAQTTISGFVTDAVTGEALFGTNILLYKDSLDLKESPFSGTATNSYGFYAIPKLSGGKYYLIARYLGYKSLIREINIGDSLLSVQYNFQMKAENINLEEIFITGERTEEIKISTVDISPELLNKLPSLSGEAALFKSLEMLPGVQTASELSSGLYVRGGSPDQNLTLVDGTILYNPAHLGNFSSTFNSDAVQSIRLIKGAFPAEYGGRLSSILDVRLRSGTKEKNKGVIALGTINSGLLLEGPLGEKSTYLISGRKMYYDFIQKKFFENSITPRYNYYDLNGKISYNISDSDILWIDGFLSKDNLYSPSNNEDIDYNIGWENNAITLNWLRINSKSVFLNSSISYVDYRFRSILNDRTPNSTAPNYFSSSILKDLFIKSSAELHIHENHVIEMGAELAAHNYHLIYNDFYSQLLEENLNSEQGIVSAEAAIYFEDKWQIFPQLKTNLGARFYYFKAQKFFRFEPRLSASYSLTDNFNLNAAFAIAHQFLHLIVRNDISLPTDLWYPSSEIINPGRSIQYVFGFDSYFHKQEYQFSVEGYYKGIQNLYEFKNVPAFIQNKPIDELLTIGEGEAYGIEFFLNKRVGDLSGWIGYTLSWTKRKFDELNAGKIFYPRYDRRHDVSIVIAYNVTDDFSIGATWTYGTGQGYTLPTGQYQFQNIGPDDSTKFQVSYTDRNAFRLPAFHKLDFNASYKFIWIGLMFDAYLNIYNLYNRQNPFSFYISKNQEGETVLRQISLFPFIPTIGVNIKF